MRFLSYLALITFTTLSGLLSVEKPNILFLYTDDHSYRTVSAYPEAYPWVKTPNIDSLAKTGIRFHHATIGTWCMPSRATLLTGKHSYGVETMRMRGPYPQSEYDPEVCRFWPSVFRKEGYETVQIGKWHTGTDTGFGRDWDHQVVWNRPRYPKNSRNYYYDQLIERDGGPPQKETGYSTDNYTKWTIDYLKSRKEKDDKKPFYLWLCYGGVHGPFTPADRHLDHYPNARVPDPADIYPPRSGKPTYSRTVEQWIKGADREPVLAKGKTKGGISANGKKTLSDWVRQVNQAVCSLDEGIGNVIRSLKEIGEYDNTLIVMTSDQGFAWGQHGFQVKKAPYDANIRSPLFISMPSRFPKGKICRHPVGGVDLVPTFFSVAGIDLPWTMHGHDLSPLLESPDRSDWDNPVLTAHTAWNYGADTDVVPIAEDDAGKMKLYARGTVPWWVSLVEGNWKYIRTLVPNEPEELYHLGNDPDELVNLAIKPTHKKRVLQMRAATIAELQRTGAKMVDSLPAVARLPSVIEVAEE